MIYDSIYNFVTIMASNLECSVGVFNFLFKDIENNYWANSHYCFNFQD